MEAESSIEVLGDNVVDDELNKEVKSSMEVLGDNVVGDELNKEVSILHPTIGMIFADSVLLYEYWKSYGQQMGFAVKKRSSKKGADGILKYVCYVCYREGKGESNSSNMLKPHPITRMDCQVKISANLDLNGQWRVTTVFLEHNHGLSPSKNRFFRCNRHISADVKRRLEINDMAGIRMNKNYGSLLVEFGEHDNIEFREKDVRNHIDRYRKLRLGEGDAEAIQRYFLKMQAQNSGFFFNMDLDADGRLRNVFWADSRSREAYKEFGEVVSFDTTSLVNKYDMPFAPFIGVNHHEQSILLGCGLILGEDTETFKWLFRTWLICMSGRAPNAIITDQDRAMQNAIEVVFPEAKHRWCLWHVMKKLPEKLGAYKNCDSICFELKSAVYDSQTTTEFEAAWVAMINKYNLHSKWLSNMYDERRRWIPCFVKHIFWAGMSTTGRSESMNSFFDGYVHSKTSLKQFVEQYDNALRSKVEKENVADFNSFSKMIPCVTSYEMEKQVQAVYTTAKFQEFQKELTGKMYCDFIERRDNNIGSEHDITEDIIFENGMSKKVKFTVLIHNNESDIKCSCRLWEFRGILCRHAIFVMIRVRTGMLIPEKYIMKMWRKDVRRCHTRVGVNYNGWNTTPEKKRYDFLLTTFTKIADLASMDEHNFKDVMNLLHDTFNRLSKNDTRYGSNLSTPMSVAHTTFTNVRDDTKQHILDPLVTRSKGRPPECRKQSPHLKSKANQTKPSQQKPSQNKLKNAKPNLKRKRDSFSENVQNSQTFLPSQSQVLEVTPTQHNFALGVTPTQMSVYPAPRYGSPHRTTPILLEIKFGYLDNNIPMEGLV